MFFLSFLFFFFFFVTGICVQFLFYTAFSTVAIRALCLLSFLMSSDAKEHIRDNLRCRLNSAVASAQPLESAAIFP